MSLPVLKMTLQIEEILNIIANPLVLFLIAVPTFTLLGILVGTWLSQPRKERVLQIIPETGRGVELEVESQDTVNAYCNPVGNTPPQRFIKRQQALNILRKGIFKLTTYALWFGRQGTAYTYKFGESKEEIKVTLKEAILNLFGKDLYERIPNDEKTGYIKDHIEQSTVGVTIEFPNDPITPENLPSISSDDLRRNDIDTFVGAIVRGVKSMGKTGGGDWVKIIFILGSGVAIGIVLSLIFKWGAPIVVSPTVAK